MDYNVAVNNGPEAQVDLSASIFGSNNSFHVRADDKLIDGQCTTRSGITECNETIKDAASGQLLLKGHTVADIMKNPADFHRTTNYSDANDHTLGTVSQHVVFDKNAKTIKADTSLSR
jgi:hypothetical protein